MASRLKTSFRRGTLLESNIGFVWIMERAVSVLGGRLMKIKERNSIENSLAYLKMILKRLSSSFEEQYAEIEDFAKYKEQAQELTNKESDKSKENLEEVLKKYFTLYKEFSANLQKEMTKNDDNKKLAELVSSVNDLVLLFY